MSYDNFFLLDPRATSSLFGLRSNDLVLGLTFAKRKLSSTGQPSFARPSEANACRQLRCQTFSSLLPVARAQPKVEQESEHPKDIATLFAQPSAEHEQSIGTAHAPSPVWLLRSKSQTGQTLLRSRTLLRKLPERSRAGGPVR